MATISTSGIEAGRIIRSAHVLRIIEALDGTETNDILISGSLIATGSVGITGSMDVVGNITGSAFTGSFAGDGSNLTGVTGEWDGSHNGNANITGSFNVSGSTGLTGSFEVSGSSTFSGSVAVSGSVTADNVFTHDLEARNGTLDVLYQDTFGFRFSLDSSPRISSLGGGIGFGSPITASFPISSSTINALNVSSSFSGSFEGDGTNLTGITAEWDGSHNGKADITGSFNVSGSTGLTGSLDIAKEDPAAIALKVSGSVIVSGSSNNFMRLTVPVQIDNATSTIKAATVSGSMSGSFQGDGSGLTGITGEWDGSRDGNAQITGSFNVSGSSGLTGSVDVSGSIVSIQAGSIIPFYFANQAAFPSAATYHGAIAHSHADGAMYFAHGGAWNQLQNSSGPFSGSVSGSFQGDGSALTGITGEWDGTRDGNAEITGSFNVSGSTGLTGSLFISGSTNTSGSVSISGSLSAGRNNDTISGSIALGTGNNLTGSDAIAIGTNNHASESADGAIMIGVLNDADANANDSIAIGRNNNMGSGGIAMGFYNEVKLGSNRVLVGNHLTSSNSGNDPYLLIGQYNEVSGVEDGFFAIGGGTSTSNRKNALVISSSADHTVHKFEDVIQLNQIHPLPTNVPTGSMATSGSAGSVKPFFWDGTNWNALY